MRRRWTKRALLLRLTCAVQTEYFLRALRQFERDRAPNAELDELAGDFLARAQHSGWLDQRQSAACGRDYGARDLFRLRWAELIGERTIYPFSLVAQRVAGLLHRFLLRHPERDPAAQRGIGAGRYDSPTNRHRARPKGSRDYSDRDLAQRLPAAATWGALEAAATAYRR